jgi:hypothetical protein
VVVSGIAGEVSLEGSFIAEFCDRVWAREKLKIGLQTSKRQPPKHHVIHSQLARSYLTLLLVGFSVRHAPWHPSLTFGSKDMRLPVR